MVGNSRKLFLNLAVKDLKKSMEFFSRLGFEFNPRFTDQNAACMVISDEAYAMLLVEPFFRTFTRREVCDTSRASEGMFALSCNSKVEVDELVRKALSLGGKPAMDKQDQGFMYSGSFYDLDGHHWEVLWIHMADMNRSGGKLRSVGAVAAGFAVIAVLSTAVDQVMHSTGVFPPWGQTMSDGLFAFALAYRIVISIAGCWLTARIAATSPMKHAIALGIFGVVVSSIGLAVTVGQGPEFGPIWYPLSLVAVSIPCGWVGGKLRLAQLAARQSVQPAI
jgi:uncharacterized protein